MARNYGRVNYTCARFAFKYGRIVGVKMYREIYIIVICKISVLNFLLAELRHDLHTCPKASEQLQCMLWVITALHFTNEYFSTLPYVLYIKGPDFGQDVIFVSVLCVFYCSLHICQARFVFSVYISNNPTNLRTTFNFVALQIFAKNRIKRAVRTTSCAWLTILINNFDRSEEEFIFWQINSTKPLMFGIKICTEKGSFQCRIDIRDRCNVCGYFGQRTLCIVDFLLLHAFP